MAAHPEFELVAAREVLATQKIIVPESAERDGCLQLLPHLHQTDGFFAAYLRKAIPAVQA